MVGAEAAGISDAVHNAVHSLPIDMRLGMYESILLCGGALMLPGASSRLERDLRSSYDERILQVRSV